jgi:hypothetical protein
MLEYVMMIVLAAVTAAMGNPVAIMAAGGAGAEIHGVGPGKPSLDKTWTSRGQENAAGSQVPFFSALTRPGSFSAEGKGFEPSIRRGGNPISRRSLRDRNLLTSRALGAMVHIDTQARALVSYGGAGPVGHLLQEEEPL